jgi:hypothetical protein
MKKNQQKNLLKKIQKNPLEYIAIKFDTYMYYSFRIMVEGGNWLFTGF